MSDIELSSLRLKVREQASRLQELEKFRRLSEDPLPPHVLPSSVSSPSHLLDSYSSLYSRLHSVLQDHATLESTLRSEMMESERQRAYIELLKQALEGPMADIGVPGSVEDLFSRKEATSKECERLKHVLKRKEGKVAELQSALREYQHTSSTIDKLKSDLSNLTSALDASQRTASELQSEKTQLLLDLQTEAADKERTEEQLHATQQSYEMLKTLYDDLHKQHSEYESRIFALEAEAKDAEMLRCDVEKMKSERRGCEVQILEGKNEREQLKSAIEALKSGKGRAEMECKVLAGQLEELTQIKDAAEEQEQSAKESLLSAKAEISHIRAQLATAEARLSESDSQRSSLQLRLAELSLLHRSAQASLSESRKDYEFLVLETRRLKATRESEVSALSAESAAQRGEVERLQSELEAAKRQVAALKDETWLCQHSLKALERTRASEEQLRKELGEARKSLAEYREEISSLSEARRTLT